MGCLGQFLVASKPFVAVIFLQFGYAGMSIIGKFALNYGMSQHVLAVYRNAIAFLAIAPFALVCDRKVRPKMTLSIFLRIMLLSLLEPVIDLNLYYTGMKYTTATFTAALCNILPAFAFLMAWVARLEKVKLRRVHSQAKVLGTLVTVGGAMIMTFMKGSMLHLPWTKGTHQHQHQHSSGGAHSADHIKGSLMIVIGCFCWSLFIILQAKTLRSYPAELSLTALICLMGAVEGVIPALILERANPAAWALHFDSKLLAIVYSGVICSGVAYYIQGIVMKSRGPVFISAFGPLCLVIVVLMGSFVLSETLYFGGVIGGVVIVCGLYLVLWGKSKDEKGNPNKGEKVAPIDAQMEDKKVDKIPNQDNPTASAVFEELV